MKLLDYMKSDYGAPALDYLVKDLGLADKGEVNYSRGMDAPENSALLEQAADILLTPETMTSRLCMLNDSEMALFERACRGPVKLKRGESVDGYNVRGSRYAFLINTDDSMQLPDVESVSEEAQAYLEIAQAMKKMSADQMEVPEDVSALYDSINTPEFQRRRHRAFVLTRCLDICKALYGSEPISVVCRLMEQELGERVSEDEVLSLFHLLPGTSVFTVYDSGTGRFTYKRISGAEYDALAEKQQGKEFYIPSPAEAEDLYRHDSLPTSPAYAHYRTFLEKNCGVDPDDSFLGVENLWEAIVDEKTPPECVQLMIDWTGADFTCKKLLLTLYRNCLLETRFPIHCGHTLPEIHAECPRLEECDFSELNFELEPDEPRRPVRIGRNDRCPCGSGKKYKKCCMIQ